MQPVTAPLWQNTCCCQHVTQWTLRLVGFFTVWLKKRFQLLDWNVDHYFSMSVWFLSIARLLRPNKPQLWTDVVMSTMMSLVGVSSELAWRCPLSLTGQKVSSDEICRLLEWCCFCSVRKVAAQLVASFQPVRAEDLSLKSRPCRSTYM